MNAATPMLEAVTAVVRKWELLPISLRMENICAIKSASNLEIGCGNSYILMACVCKDNDWKAAQDCHSTLWVDDPYVPSIRFRVSLDKVGEDQYDQVSDGDQCNDTRIF